MGEEYTVGGENVTGNGEGSFGDSIVANGDKVDGSIMRRLSLR